MRMIRVFAGILVVLSMWMPVRIALAERVYVWGVVPQFGPTIVHRDWTPLLQELERRTGFRFRLVTADSFDFFERKLYAGDFDFVYANPYQTILAYREQGYLPLVRDAERRLTGILVVRRDSPFHDVQDLDGERIAFAAPNAFAVSLYLRALLREREGLDFTPEYVGTHSNAFRQVLLGRIPACGGVYRTLNKERPEVRDHLRVIYEAPSTITHAVAVHPRVSGEVRDAVQLALLDLAGNQAGREILRRVFLPQPVAADFERDYRPLEALDLDKYVVMPE